MIIIRLLRHVYTYSLSFLSLLAQITSAGRLVTLHATASTELEFSEAVVHLFHSHAIRFTYHVACFKLTVVLLLATYVEVLQW